MLYLIRWPATTRESRINFIVGLVESEWRRAEVNYGGPTLCPAFGQPIQEEGGVVRGYLKLIPDSCVVAN